jgi:hypothetical protein
MCVAGATHYYYTTYIYPLNKKFQTPKPYRYMKNYLILCFLFLLTFSVNAQDEDSIPTVSAESLQKLAPPTMTYEQLMGIFKPLRNIPEGTPLKELQEKEKKLRELRDNANYLLRYVVDPIKKKAAENRKIEKEAIEEQKKFNAKELEAKQAEQERREQKEALRNSKRKKDRQMFSRMEEDSTNQAEEETMQTSSEGSEGTAAARLETAEKELEKMRKETEPTEKLANIIRTEWAKLHTRIQTETDKAGEGAAKSFETLTLEQVYDVATKTPKMEIINYYKENLFYSKKPYQINCKSGAGATLLKGMVLEKGQNLQGCIGYISSLNKNEMYNLIIIQLTDGSIKAILWGKNNEPKTTESDYKAGVIAVF